MAIIGFFAFKNNNVLFSLWDSQGKIKPTDTDSFEVFKEITYHLRPKFPLFKRKQLVIIEDLDRSTDKDMVSQLLKELYRFDNLLRDKEKKQFIFIVSLKSEQSLNNLSTTQKTNEDVQKENLSVYSKIFDYTVWIRPLYFENIREIFETLLYSKFDNKKVNEILPQLYWIMQGHNLTVREIKDRLNEVFLLHSSLSGRDKVDSAVKYNKCSAVVYLQRQYPSDFQKLILEEKTFSEIVKNYYYNSDVPDNKSFPKEVSGMFIKDFNEMLKAKDIENDYAMYFFNYPKNAEIMTLEERYIYDSIIHNSYIASEKNNINKMLDNIIKNKKQKIIEKALKELMEYHHDFGEFVFDFERIFEIAIELKQDYTLLSLSGFIKEFINKEKSIFYIAEICNYNYIKNNKFLKDAIISIYISAVYEEYQKTNNKPFIEGCRINIIKYFPDSISCFSQLFIDSNLPNTDVSTLSLLKNTKDIFSCLNFSLITQNDYKTYLEYLCKIDISPDDGELLLKGILSIPSLSSIVDSYILLQKLLMKNKIFEESLFDMILLGYVNINDTKPIIDYVQSIKYEQLSDEILKKIDELITYEITDFKLIKLLESKGFYKTAIFSRLSIANFTDFDFENKWIKENIVELGKNIIASKNDLFILLRTEFIKNKQSSIIYHLFESPFDFVKESELQEVRNISDIYYLTDFKRITAENCLHFTNYCNSHILTSDKLFSFFKALFFEFENDENRITSKEMIFIILRNINFEKCNFSSMNQEQQNNIIEVFSPLLQLNEANNALEFMKIIKCHIDNLDKIVQNTIETEKDSLFINYIEWCNKVPHLSDKTIEFINEKNTHIPLVPEITKILFDKKMFVAYIIGKSLYDGAAFYTDSISLSNYYEAFCRSDEYYNLIKDSSFIDLFNQTKLYDDRLDLKRLECFRKYRQSYKLIELNLKTIQTDQERKKYIYSISHIDTYEDSLRFIDLIVSEQYRHLFDNDNAFKEAVKRKLWEIDPNGKKKPGVLKRIFTNKLERNNSRRIKPLI